MNALLAPPAIAAADTFARQNGLKFWIAVILTGVGTGLCAAVLYILFESVQRFVWPGSDPSLIQGVASSGPGRHLSVLLGAGLLIGIGQIVLSGLSSGNGIDINAAIWFSAGRLPTLRTLGSALLSIVIVGMGVSLGREGAPKQAGAVIGNLLSDRANLSEEQRRLLVACGAGAGMAAAYGVSGNRRTDCRRFRRNCGAIISRRPHRSNWRRRWRTVDPARR